MWAFSLALFVLLSTALPIFGSAEFSSNPPGYEFSHQGSPPAQNGHRTTTTSTLNYSTLNFSCFSAFNFTSLIDYSAGIDPGEIDLIFHAIGTFTHGSTGTIRADCTVYALTLTEPEAYDRSRSEFERIVRDFYWFRTIIAYHRLGSSPPTSPRFTRLSSSHGSITEGDDMPGEEKKATQKKARERRNQQLTAQKAYIEKRKAKGPKAKAKIEKALGSTKVIKGRGDYEMGKNLGSKVGSWIGGNLHKWLTTLFGSGDYHVQANTSELPNMNSFVAAAGVPAMQNDSAGDVDVSFHEYAGELGMTEEYNVTTFEVNPMNTTTFPWFSTIAANFQQWTPMGIVFFLKTTSSDVVVAPTQGMGSISGSVRYDVDSTPPANLEEMLNNVSSSSAKPSVNQAFPIECARDQTTVNVMKIQQPGSTSGDRQFYTLCYIDFATADAANAYPGACQVWVTYRIRLKKPRLPTAPNTGLMFMRDTVSTSMANMYTAVADTVAVKQPRINTLGLVADPSFPPRLIFPVTIAINSVYCCIFQSSGAQTGNVFRPTVLSGGGMVAANAFLDQSSNEAHAPTVDGSSAGLSQALAVYFFRYDGTGTQDDPPYVYFSTFGSVPFTTSLGGTDRKSVV